jgi:diguanylate cyclase (GGDEF)-like protein
MLFCYASLGIFAFLIILGYAPPSLTFVDGHVSPEYGWWLLSYLAPLIAAAGAGGYSLVKKLIVARDLQERNKIGYLCIAVSILIIAGFIGITPLANKVPISHIGGMLAAATLAYAVVNHELVSISFVLRRTLGSFLLASFGFIVNLLLFLLIHLMVGFELRIDTMLFATAAMLGVSWLLFWTRPIFLGTIDQIFLKDKYQYRHELQHFVSHKMGEVFSLEELSEGLLPPLVKALDCQGAHVLLLQANGDFIVEYSEPKNEQIKKKYRIKQDSPMVTWLMKEYLSDESITIHPQFRGLWQEERDEIRALGIELFFPLVSRSHMVGILALCQKNTGQYSIDDTNLVESIASQVAIAMDKIYYQEELKKRERELTFINRLASVMTSSLNIQEIYTTFVDGLREIIDVDFAAITLIDGKELHFVATSTSAHVKPIWKVDQKIPLRGTATQWVASHKKTMIEQDLSRDKMFTISKAYFKIGIRSIIYLPLITKDECIGSLVIGNRNPNAYMETQISLLEKLALQISTSVVNAKLYARTAEKARIDELTGLYNRRHFEEIIQQEIDRHARYGSIFSLAFVDLDEFKNYNDSLGHVAGDVILEQIGKVILTTIRNVDSAFRYGGDEFAVIMPNTTIDNASTVIERIRLRIESEYGSMKQIPVTSSFGLAAWPSDGLTKDHIVNAADKALYYAKRTGGNRACLVSQMLPSLSEPTEKMTKSDKEVLNIIYALASTIEARDTYTYGHSRKVQFYAVLLAEALKLPAEKVAIVSHAALLHDIGKIGIYDGVLNKPGRLDIKEMELIKTHPDLSRTIVGHVDSLTPCLPAIHQHHERWDGTGYPNGLKGEAICLEGRILAIADAFDAMTSKRPYREPLSTKKAIQELKNGAGTQFDPRLVEIFIPIALSSNIDNLTVLGRYEKALSV